MLYFNQEKADRSAVGGRRKGRRNDGAHQSGGSGRFGDHERYLEGNVHLRLPACGGPDGPGRQAGFLAQRQHRLGQRDLGQVEGHGIALQAHRIHKCYWSYFLIDKVKRFDSDIGEGISDALTGGRSFTILIVGVDDSGADAEPVSTGTLVVPKRSVLLTDFTL